MLSFAYCCAYSFDCCGYGFAAAADVVVVDFDAAADDLHDHEHVAAPPADLPYYAADDQPDRLYLHSAPMIHQDHTSAADFDHVHVVVLCVDHCILPWVHLRVGDALHVHGGAVLDRDVCVPPVHHLHRSMVDFPLLLLLSLSTVEYL